MTDTSCLLTQLLTHSSLHRSGLGFGWNEFRKVTDKFFRFKWTTTAGIGIHPTKAWLSQLVNFKNAIWTLGERYAIKFFFKLGKMPCNESWIYCYDPETKRQSSQWKHAGSPRPKKARQSKSTHKLLMIPFFDSTGMIYMHWVPTGQTVN